MITIEKEKAAAPQRTTAQGNQRGGKSNRLSTTKQDPNKSLPSWLTDLLANAPYRGQGMHDWLFNTARKLHWYRSEQEIIRMLQTSVEGRGDVPLSEIITQVRDAEKASRKKNGAHKTKLTGFPLASMLVPLPRKPKWPIKDNAEITEIVTTDPSALDQLKKSSPIKISPSLHDSECLIERLFPNNPWLCIGTAMDKFSTRRRLDFVGELKSKMLIVPSPMTEKWGITKNGKKSQHTLSNTGERYYIITEFDEGTKDEQAAIIRHLAKLAPLVMVVDSGGRSLHGWFHCQGTPPSLVHRFFSYAVLLGADPKMWTKSQFARLPLGWRVDKGKIQEVLFFDYSNTATRKGAAR